MCAFERYMLHLATLSTPKVTPRGPPSSKQCSLELGVLGVVTTQQQ